MAQNSEAETLGANTLMLKTLRAETLKAVTLWLKLLGAGTLVAETLRGEMGGLNFGVAFWSAVGG